MTRAIYPGSFDPLTNGHLDVIRRASKIFNELYVAVMINKSKVCSFSTDERIDFIKRCTTDINNIKVISSDGLTVDLAKKLNCSVIVKGIRAVSDYEYELAQATGNMMLNSDVETCLLVSRPELSFLSSSVAKEIASFGGDVSKFIPSIITKDVVDRLKK